MKLHGLVSIAAALFLLGSGVGVLADDKVDGTIGAKCGGDTTAHCGAGLYCDFGDGQGLKPSSCGHAGQPGQCAKIPEICTDEFKPVCGCDGKGYTNACRAHEKGVTVAKPGKCFTPKSEPPPGEKK